MVFTLCSLLDVIILNIILYVHIYLALYIWNCTLHLQYILAKIFTLGPVNKGQQPKIQHYMYTVMNILLKAPE